MVNVAQIGVGRWGANILRNLVNIEGFNISIVVDISQDRLDFVKGLYPFIRVSSDISMVWDDPAIEGVIIATPIDSHFDLTMKALSFNKHVFVEKPMSTKVDEVLKVRELSRRKGLVVMAGYVVMYHGGVRYLKGLIDSGELGSLYYIYGQRLNFASIRDGVDILWDLAPHDISIVQYLLDYQRPESISISGMDYIRDGFYDVAFINVKYSSNVIVNIQVSGLDTQKTSKFTVVASDKIVVFDDMVKNKIAIYNRNISSGYNGCDVLYPSIDFSEPLRVEFEHFYDCIINNTLCMTGPDHILDVVSILSSGGYYEGTTC